MVVLLLLPLLLLLLVLDFEHYGSRAGTIATTTTDYDEFFEARKRACATPPRTADGNHPRPRAERRGPANT